MIWIHRIVSHWGGRGGDDKANNRRKKLSIPVRGYALAEGLHNPSISTEVCAFPTFEFFDPDTWDCAGLMI